MNRVRHIKLGKSEIWQQRQQQQQQQRIRRSIFRTESSKWPAHNQQQKWSPSHPDSPQIAFKFRTKKQQQNFSSHVLAYETCDIARHDTHAACNDSSWSTGKLSLGDMPRAPRACTQTPTWKKDVRFPPMRFSADFQDLSRVLQKCLSFLKHNFLHSWVYETSCVRLCPIIRAWREYFKK